MSEMPAKPALYDLLKPVHGEPFHIGVLLFHMAMSILVFLTTVYMIYVLYSTTVWPAHPQGWGTTIDYDAKKGTRNSLVNYMTAQKLPVDSTPMNAFTVATANFGGIFTEEGLFTPWTGTVHPEAGRLQVEAGARAVLLDIWPDPSERSRAVVCSMMDTDHSYIDSLWKKWGLTRGVGRYSNWKCLTRNKVAVSDILGPMMKAAFASSPGPQNSDPFFLILNLHGAMTIDYLNKLGDTIRSAIGGHAMGASWNYAKNQKAIPTEPVKTFLSKVFVLTVPDINPNCNSLPNINTYPAFTAAFLKTSLGEATNALEQVSKTMLVEPDSITAVSAMIQPNCTDIAGPPQSLAQIGFVAVQPSIGRSITNNTQLFKDYTGAIQSGAQFVGVNLFSSDDDTVLTQYFDPSLFGTFSFRKT